MNGSVSPIRAVPESSLTEKNLYLGQLFDSLAEQAILTCPKFSGAAIILKVPGSELFEGVGGGGVFDGEAVRSFMRYDGNANNMLSIATRNMGESNTYWIQDVPGWVGEQSATVFQNVYDSKNAPSQMLAVSLWRKDASLADIERIGLLVYNDWMGSGSPADWSRQNVATLELLRNKIAYFGERLLDDREKLLKDLASGSTLDTVLSAPHPKARPTDEQLLGAERRGILLASLIVSILGGALSFCHQVALRDVARGVLLFLSSGMIFFLFFVGLAAPRAVVKTCSFFAACMLFYEIVIALRLLAGR